MTTTAVPSKLPEDFALNIENLDKLINSDEATFANRFGVDKMTVQGAIDTIKAFNNRGAWVALKAYLVKDLVLTGGTWYVCVVAHTSSAAFATDTASKWRVYQGVVFGDLAASTGASLIGFTSSPGRTVQQQLEMLYYGIANVTDPKYGAVDNGTDATVAIQAAIDALPVGGMVHGDGKTFTVTSLLLKSNMTLRNINLLTKAGTLDMASPITIDGRTSAKINIKIFDVSIDGNRINQTAIVTADEDGGRHGIRVVGTCSDLWLERVTASNCAGDGLEVFSSTSNTGNDANFVFNNLNLKDCVFNGNRRHGMSADSVAKFRMNNVELNENGLDLNAVDPLTSGGRGARAGGLLYGNGFDFEGYGIGSCFDSVRMHRITALGNARSGGLFYDAAATRGAGFSPRQKIWISESYFHEGVDASRDGSALAFTSTVGSKALAPLYTSVYISTTRLDGWLLARNVDNLQIDGDVISPAAFFVLLDYATNCRINARPSGAGTAISSTNSSFTQTKGVNTGDQVVPAMFTGTAVAASGVSTAVLTLPNGGAAATYMVTATIDVGDAVNYCASAVVLTAAGSARIVQQANAPLQTITLAGLSISSTQSSGGTQTVTMRALRIGV